jgi:hypothetical protein
VGGKAYEPDLNLRVAAPSRVFEGAEGLVLPSLAARRIKHLACFYEIRSADNTLLKRDGGFPTQDAAKIAGRADAKKIKNSCQPDKPDIERIMLQ